MLKMSSLFFSTSITHPPQILNKFVPTLCITHILLHVYRNRSGINTDSQNIDNRHPYCRMIFPGRFKRNRQFVAMEKDKRTYCIVIVVFDVCGPFGQHIKTYLFWFLQNTCLIFGLYLHFTSTSYIAQKVVIHMCCKMLPKCVTDS